jgi:hypothetical protein
MGGSLAGFASPRTEGLSRLEYGGRSSSSRVVVVPLNLLVPGMIVLTK